MNNARVARRDRNLLATADLGRVRSHRELITVSGRLEPVSRPLIAPFSGEECLICEYDLRRPDSQTKSSSDSDANPGSDYAGFLMVPTVVKTDTDRVPLLGYPLLEGFHEHSCRSADAVRNAMAFVNNTEFENRSGLGMLTVFSVFDTIWSDDDGLVQKNIQIRTPTQQELFPVHPDQLPNLQQEDDEEDDDEIEADSSFSQMPEMSEKRVDAGTEVCVIGIYDEVRGGIGPVPGKMTPTRLLKGSRTEIEGRLRTTMIRYIMGGTFGLIALHAVILLVILVFRQSDDFKEFQQSQQAEEQTQ
ncbi:MAG: hypothetical protein JNL58_32370 [Planctomyces sp.]|nr:hypothetical protein [Planctomyces sp.]